MIEFSYRKEYSPVLGHIYRPSAEVILKHNDKIVLFYPYIDSGADITLIPRSLGEMLGLKISDDIVELGGLGNNKVAVLIKMHRIFHPVYDRWRTTTHAHRLRGKILAPKRNRPERSEHPTGLMKIRDFQDTKNHGFLRV